MAGFNKNFVVKNGLEVHNILILADADSDQVGIKTDSINYTLHVNGGIGATTLYATGISTFNSIHLAGNVTAGTSGIGDTGQYLVRTGTGVTWQNLPSTRSSEVFTALPAQTLFLTSYTVGFLDVFINGVKLAESEYTANDTASVILNTACFGGETVEFISYSSVNPGYGYTGIYGISLFEEGSPVGTTGQVVALNFVGAAVSATATGVAATITITPDTLYPNYWEKTTAGIHTTSNVGIATTNPRFALEVGAVGASGTSLWVNGNARVTGILTVGSSSIVLDGSNNTINVGSGITINGNTGIVSASNFYANGIQVGVISATTIVYQGSTLSPSQWVSTAAGIHTLSNVGIGTTNPTSTLTVGGNTKTDTLNVTGVSTFNNATTVKGDFTVSQTPSGDPTFKLETTPGNQTNAGGFTLGPSGFTFGLDPNNSGHTFGWNVDTGNTGYGYALKGYGGFKLKLQNQQTFGGNPTTDLVTIVDDGSTTIAGNIRVAGISTLAANGGITTTGGSLFTKQLSVSGVSTFIGIATFRGNTTVTELGNTSYDGIRFLGGASNFAIVQSDSLGNLTISCQSTATRFTEINGQHRFYASNGNIELNLSDIGTTKVGSGITFTASTGNIYATSVRVGINTSQGVILTSPNGTKYQLFVENDGTLKTVAV